MRPGRTLLAVALMGGCLAAPAWADKVTRSVDRQGVPTITIKGNEKANQPVEAAVAPKKEFQVYELDGEGAPAPEAAPQIVIVPPPPPIAPNPAAYGGYGYGYGYGYDYPWIGPGCGPYYNFPAGQPLNYQNPPVNYQNPPVNYQNPPANYQPRPMSLPNSCYRRR